MINFYQTWKEDKNSSPKRKRSKPSSQCKICNKRVNGLKLKYLEQLAPVDLTGQDMEAELKYTAENALYLMKNSSNFDGFISEQVSDLGNFSTSNSNS